LAIGRPTKALVHAHGPTVRGPSQPTEKLTLFDSLTFTGRHAAELTVLSNNSRLVDSRLTVSCHLVASNVHGLADKPMLRSYHLKDICTAVRHLSMCPLTSLTMNVATFDPLIVSVHVMFCVVTCQSHVNSIVSVMYFQCQSVSLFSHLLLSTKHHI